MEASYVYQNERSKRSILIGIILPMIPLFAYLLAIYLFDLDGIYIIFAVIYLCFWIGFFALLISSIYEVMAVYMDRIVFINPFRRKEFALSRIKMIYYNVNRGISFTLNDDRMVKMGFNFKYDNDVLEELMKRLSGFIGFTEEHIHESSIYCLVKKK